MKRTTQRSKRIVTFLGDPDPRFVALVNRGANQRPFHSLKRAEGAEPEQEKDMANKALKIHTIVFDGASFENEDAVKAYLDEKGYTDYEVSKTEKGFAVENEPAENFPEGTREVRATGVKGVTYVVGAGADAPSEKSEKGDDAKTEKTDDKDETAGQEQADKTDDTSDADADADNDADADADAQKSDDTPEGDPAKDVSDEKVEADATKGVRRRVRRSALDVGDTSVNALIAAWEGYGDAIADTPDLSSKSLAETLASYTGGMPPGMYDLVDAFAGEVRKMFKSGSVDEKKMASLAGDFTRAAMAMHDAFVQIMAAKTGVVMSEVGDAADEMTLAAVEELLSILFDEPADDSALAKSVSEMAASVKSLTDEVSQLRAKSDAQEIALIEAQQKSEALAKDAPGTRTVPGRKSGMDETAGAGDGTSQKGVPTDPSDPDVQRIAKRNGWAVPA